MNRLTLALTILVLLAIDAVALAAPQEQEEPVELREGSWHYGNSRDPDPGAACLTLSLEHYRLVLTDPENRADHFYLAQTYQFLAQNKVAC